MKRKLLTLVVVVAGLSLSACQEDSTMDELIQDTELNSTLEPDDDPDNDGGIPPVTAPPVTG